MADDDTSTAPVFDMMTDAERLVAVTRELAAAQVEAATYKERAKSLKEQIKLLNQKPAQPVQGGNTMATSNNTPAQPAPAAPVQATNLNGPGAYTMPNGITVVNVMPASPMVPVAASRSGALLALAFTLCMIVLVVLAGLIVSKYGFSIDTPKAAEVTPPPADKAGDPPAAKADEAKAADEATTPPNDGEKVEAAEQDASMRISCKEFRGDGSEKFLKDMAESWTNLRERCGLAKQAPPASDTPPASADPAEASKSIIPINFNINIGSVNFNTGSDSSADVSCTESDRCEMEMFDLPAQGPVLDDKPVIEQVDCCDPCGCKKPPPVRHHQPKKVVPKRVVETSCRWSVYTPRAIDVYFLVDGKRYGKIYHEVLGSQQLSVPCGILSAQSEIVVCFGEQSSSHYVVGDDVAYDPLLRNYKKAKQQGRARVVLNSVVTAWDGRFGA
jgi:hypothetical protein